MDIEDNPKGKEQKIYMKEREDISTASDSLLELADIKISFIRSELYDTEFLEFVNNLHGFIDANDKNRGTYGKR